MDPAKRLEKIKKSIQKLGHNEKMLSDLNRYISMKISEAKMAKPWEKMMQKDATSKDIFSDLSGKFKG